jgi:beta-lactamase class D
MKRLAAPVFVGVLALLTPTAFATEACTLIVAADDGHEIYRSGDRCDEAFSPASTFKLAMALMGFDSGLLESPDAPAIPYDPALNAPFEAWRRTVTPTTWLRDSVVWYSQVLTRKLGMGRFKAYADAFDYGNRDLSGDPGEDNGLTRAWLGSSLKITPEEQTAFLRKILLRQLPVEAAAYDMLFTAAPVFDGSDGWRIQAKTGSAWPLDMKGRQLGWFAGWMEKDEKTFIFSRLYVDMPRDGVAGSDVRDCFLVEVGPLMASLQG